MKKNYLKRTGTTFLFFLSIFFCNAQVGIGNTNPSSDALLDIGTNSSTAGLRLPRVALTTTNSASPLSAHVSGMLIYNTATAGTGNNAVTPGFYYNDGTNWVRLANNDDWKLAGNAGTNPTNDFVGTTDNQNLIFRTNNLERLRLVNDGRVSVNGPPQFSADRFTVNGANDESSINGYSLGSNGIGIYGENNSTGIGVIGNSFGVGVVGLSTTNIGVWGDGGTGTGVLALTNNSTDFGVNASNSDNSGTGILASGNNLTGGYLISGTGISATGDTGALAYSPISTGNGIIASGNNFIPPFQTLTGGSGGVFNAVTNGIYSYYNTSGDGQGLLIQDAYTAQWNVGAWFLTSYYKIIGAGSVSTIIKDLNDQDVVMFCPESPENFFQDYGHGKLVNGRTHIEIDPILSKNIIVNSEHPLKVFIQLEGDCNGVYVTNKTKYGFDVIELQNGTSNVDFTYSITATRGNEIYINKDTGETKIAKYDKRFPKAPDFKQTNKYEYIKSKTKEYNFDKFKNRKQN